MGVAAGIIANALARERLEHDAAKQHEALAHALRLSSMGQLATGIAHELNQPLTAIANYSRACVRRIATFGVEKAELSDILDRVSDEAIRAGGIIHNLRKHVKGGRSQRKRVPLDDIIDHAVSLLTGTARENKVDIIIDRRAESPNVRVDAIQVEQVVINLVQNAIESIASTDSTTREIHITTNHNRSFVDVEISDTGSGFSSDEAEKLFDQFHTTKPAGLGLGLSISRHLIESNGGTIEATASQPTGATFQFSLPIARAARTRKTASTNDD
jgi:C4-dicarboxylate-specific signal transduction histidine kinase